MSLIPMRSRFVRVATAKAYGTPIVKVSACARDPHGNLRQLRVGLNIPLEAIDDVVDALRAAQRQHLANINGRAVCARWGASGEMEEEF
ncbi:hypothetical protein ACO2Q3_22655 [Caulobacter sp. KR2-114]|uniref:hypothetical protein n=1 Tax=Caulobacter sp. KR2-114 TaxID=3400912 RepID=UPI003C0CE420